MEYATLLQRVRSEFNEMPGLRLTPAQAARLLGLDTRSCQRILNALVNSAFLRWTADGSVIRAES
jgi:DNA-binding IclR family transcriptional regulator